MRGGCHRGKQPTVQQKVTFLSAQQHTVHAAAEDVFSFSYRYEHVMDCIMAGMVTSPDCPALMAMTSIIEN